MKRMIRNPKAVQVLSSLLLLCSSSLFGDDVDFFVDMIVSDGVGCIESDYYYHASGYPKTAKVEFEYYSWNYCRKLDDTTSSSAALCGFWNTSKGGLSGARAHKTGEVVFWHGSTSGKNSSISGASKEGYGRVEFDYLAKRASWSSSDKTKVVDDLQLPSGSVTVPYHICALENTNPSYIGIYSFRVYEQLSETGNPEFVHDYVPCCAQGKPALYDKISKKILFSTTDGFTLPMTNDISVASGGKLHVSRHTATQNSCTLADGSELIFDGLTTLRPTGDLVLPENGRVVISLPESRLSGTYELVSGLPSDFSLSQFEVGTLPKGCVGELKKVGTSLHLSIKRSVACPDAIGTMLKSDAHGYIDTGYGFKNSDSLKTSRIELKFKDSTQGKGTLPGPTNNASARPILGFWHGAVRSGARWYFTDSICFGSGGDPWSFGSMTSSKGPNNDGEHVISADYIHGTMTWNSKTVDVSSPSSDNAHNYYLFNIFDGNGPMSEFSSVYSLRSFKVYESIDKGVTERLARDFVPCLDSGRPGLYDQVTGAVIHPVADTNGFELIDASYCVGVSGDCAYVPTGTQVTIPVCSDGYVLLRKSSGTVLGFGSESVVSFEMPAEAVVIEPSQNIEVPKGGIMSIDDHTFCHDVSFNGGAVLEFTPKGAMYVSGDIAMTNDGVIEIKLSGVVGPGDYAVIYGVPADFDLSKFSVAVMESGYVASLEIRGNVMIVQIRDDPNGAPRFVTSILSDGAGWFDTSYFYKGAAYPRTSRVSFEFGNFYYSRKPNTPGAFAAQFGFWGGKNMTSMTRSYNNQLIVYYGSEHNGNYTAFPETGRASIDMDYFGENAKVTHGGVTTVLTDEMKASAFDSTLSYWLCGCNGNNSPSYLQIYSFKVWEKDSADSPDRLSVNCVPCVSLGKPALYDTVRKKVLFPIHSEGAVNGFKVADWGGVITQRYDVITTVSSVPVSTPAFAPQGSYTFTADGSFTVNVPVKRIEIHYCDLQGVSTSSLVDSPKPGRVFDVVLGGASKAVVSVVNVDGYVCSQNFGFVRVDGTAQALHRPLPRGKMELMIASDSMISFAAETGAVDADMYNAAGELISAKRIAEFVLEGGSLNVELGDAEYMILRIAAKRKGFFIRFR